MPPLISEEERATILRDWDTYTPEKRAKAERLGVKPPEPAVSQPLQGPRLGGQTLDVDPRASSPWYQRALESLIYGNKDPDTAKHERREAWEKDPYWGSSRPKNPWEYVMSPEDTRTGLQDILPLTAALATEPGPAKIPVAIQMARGPLWNLLQNVGPAAYRTILTYLTANAGTKAANILDPEHHVDPEQHATMTAGGQALGELGGYAVDKGLEQAGKFTSRYFGDTPQGATMRTTLEGQGGEAAVGTTTKSPFLKSASELLEHMPGGARLRHIKERGQQLIDDALQDYSRLFRGDDVSRRVPGMITPPAERSMLDLEAPLRPVLPGRRQTELDAAARLRPHLAMGNDQDLVQVPREVARRVPEAIQQQQDATNVAFSHLRDVVGNSPLDARVFKATLQHTPLPAGTQAPSIFHEVEDFKRSLAMLPDTMTADMAFDIRKRLLQYLDEAQKLKGNVSEPLAEHINRGMVPELGQTLSQLNKLLEGRMVNLQPLKDEARTILGGYEQGLKLPQQILEGSGSMGKVPALEDPHIMAARNILQKENFVQFDEAQQILADLNALRRHPGPNIGNAPKDAGERLRDILWGNASQGIEGEIMKTAKRLDPSIEPVFRNAQQLYERGASLYNSPLIMDLSKASLDDILTKIVQNERPEDLRALHAVLGDHLFDRVGQMWLRRVEQASTNPVTKVVSAGQVQEHLGALRPIAEEQLFPQGQVARLKVQTDRTAAMEQALRETNPRTYDDLTRQMTRVDAQHVGEIRLSQLLERNRDPVTGVINFDAALTGIQDLHATGMDEKLWPGTQLGKIQDSLRQASALKRSLTTDDPLVLKELQKQSGPHWDTAGELRLSNIFRDATDAQGNFDVGRALNAIHGIRGEAEQILYGNKLTPLKSALRKADAMQQVMTVLDKPELITKYRQVVNDPLAWQAVERDVLAPGFKMSPRTPEMPGPAMIDGRALVNHINALRRNPDVARALFPDPRILDELHHLGETAMVLARHSSEVPYAGRHYPFLVSFEADGTPKILGSKMAGTGLAVAGTVTGMNKLMTWLITNPRRVRLFTQGMHTPLISPQASRVMGALVGALKSEGYTLETPQQETPLPLPGD